MSKSRGEIFVNIKNNDQWLDFIKKSSYNYKYSFTDKLYLYDEDPDGKTFANRYVWEKVLNRQIPDNAYGIELSDGDIVYEINQTSGDSYIPVFNPSEVSDEAISNIFYINDISDKTFMANRVFYNIKDKVLDVLNSQGIGQSNLYDTISSSVGIATLERLGLNSENFNVNINSLEEITLNELEPLINISYKEMEKFISSVKEEVNKIIKERGIENVRGHQQSNQTQESREVGNRERRVSEKQSEMESQEFSRVRGTGGVSQVPPGRTGESRQSPSGLEEEVQGEDGLNNRASEQRLDGVQQTELSDGGHNSRNYQRSDNISRREQELEINKEDTGARLEDETEAPFYFRDNEENSRENKDDLKEELENKIYEDLIENKNFLQDISYLREKGQANEIENFQEIFNYYYSARINDLDFNEQEIAKDIKSEEIFNKYLEYLNDEVVKGNIPNIFSNNNENEKRKELEKAIIDYSNEELSMDIKYEDFNKEFPDEEDIGLAYTETPINNHSIQFSINLKDYTWGQYVDDELISTGSFSDESMGDKSPIENMIDFINNRSFEELIDVDPDDLRSKLGLEIADDGDFYTLEDYFLKELNIDKFSRNKFLNNIEITNLIKDIDDTGRNITREDIDKLNTFTDWERISQFDEQLSNSIAETLISNNEDLDLYDIEEELNREIDVFKTDFNTNNISRIIEKFNKEFEVNNEKDISKNHQSVYDFEDGIYDLIVNNEYLKEKIFFIKENNIDDRTSFKVNAALMSELGKTTKAVIEAEADDPNEMLTRSENIEVRNKIVNRYMEYLDTIPEEEHLIYSNNYIKNEMLDWLKNHDELKAVFINLNDNNYAINLKESVEEALQFDNEIDQYLLDRFNGIPYMKNKENFNQIKNEVIQGYREYLQDEIDKGNIENIFQSKKEFDLGFYVLGDGITISDNNLKDYTRRDLYKLALINNDGTVELTSNLDENYSENQIKEIYNEVKLKAIENLDIFKGPELTEEEKNQIKELDINFDDLNSYILSDKTDDLDFQERIDEILNKPDKKENISENSIENNQKEAEIAENLPRSNIEAIERFHITDDQLGEYTPKERYKRNLEAIKLYKDLKFSEREITNEDKVILSQYTGWGGLSEVFDIRYDDWFEERIELDNTLEWHEYNKAELSTLNSFYTSPHIIDGMYEALNDMGLTEGKVLEPSCGVGNFLGKAPIDSNYKFTAIELDEISGSIAKNIYENDDVIVSDFKDFLSRDNQFDLVIGNVPFGKNAPYDPSYKKEKFNLHNYFIAKSIDKAKPNGVIALITSSGTMDQKNSKSREYFAKRAELLGAIRLPTQAFKENANTEAETDILFFQKRENLLSNEEVQELGWINSIQQTISVENEEVYNNINQYFLDNPEMILGNIEPVSGRYGTEFVCKYHGDNFKEDLRDKLKMIETDIELPSINETIDVDERINLDEIDIPVNLREYSYFISGNELYFKRTNDQDIELIEETGVTRERIEGMIKVRDELRTLMSFERSDEEDEVIENQRQILSETYDDFVNKYGRISEVTEGRNKKTANRLAFERDVSYTLISNLENLNIDGEFESKADIFEKRTIYPRIMPTIADNPKDALNISLNYKGVVDIDYMSELCQLTKEEVVDSLEGIIYRNFSKSLDELGEENKFEKGFGVYETADEYLSGNIIKKLSEEEKAYKVLNEILNHNELENEFNNNKSWLEKSIPERLTANEIYCGIESNWIPLEYKEEFIKEYLGLADMDFTLEYSPINGNFSFKKTDYYYGFNKNDPSTSYKTGFQIVEACLNQKNLKVNIKNEETDKYVEDPEETMLVQQKQEEVREAFKDWIYKDYDRRKDLENIYNDNFNAIRPREYDGSHLIFPEMSDEITLRQHQKDVVARALYGGNTLMAHCVGAGKTYSMASIAMESKRLGLSNKSLIIVPKHIINQWGRDFKKLYPSSNLLIANEKDLTKENRKEFLSKISLGNYDAVLMTHDQFKRIPLSPERQKLNLETRISKLSNEIEAMAAINKKSFTVKEMQAYRKRLESQLEQLQDTGEKDDILCFEELGIDRLFVDESDIFKNLKIFSQIQVSGIGSRTSQRAQDLYDKVEYINERTNNKGVVYATGTPISNSVSELFVTQTALQNKELENHGIETFDKWASNFAIIGSKFETKPEGDGYQLKTRMNGFKNIPDLVNIFSEVADVKNQEDLDLDIPEKEYINIVSERSEIQKEAIKAIGERAERLRFSGGFDPSKDNFLKITNDGRNLALDQRMIDNSLPEDPNCKSSLCADNVFKIWKDNEESKSTQLIFSDIAVPNDDPNKFSVYDDLKNKLIDKGIPETEIAFIHDANTDKRKEKLFAKVRKGEVRVLIGSTEKMGAGTNVQDKVIALHHLDCPWRPRDMEQREGRAIRQGNENNKVNIYRYVTKDTFDTYNYQLIEQKQNFISSIMKPDLNIRVLDDIDDMTLDYKTVKSLTVGNPLIREKMELELEVDKLEILEKKFTKNKYELEDKVNKKLPEKINRIERSIERLEKDLEQYKENTKYIDTEEKLDDGSLKKEKVFPGITLKNKFYSDKAEAANALENIMERVYTKDGEEVGEYKGFKIYMGYDYEMKTRYSYLKNNSTHFTNLTGTGLGSLNRIEKELDSGIELKLKNNNIELKKAKNELNISKKELEKSFNKKDELENKRKKLKNINIELGLENNVRKIDGVCL